MQTLKLQHVLIKNHPEGEYHKNLLMHLFTQFLSLLKNQNMLRVFKVLTVKLHIAI